MSRSWSSLTPPLSATTASAITKMGFSAMTPVQSACIPLLLGGHKVGKIRMTLGNVNRIWNYISKSSFCLYQCRISCRVKKCPPSLDSGLLKPLKLGRNFASEIFRANGPPPEPDGATNESCFSRNFWVALSGSGTWKTSEVNLKMLPATICIWSLDFWGFVPQSQNSGRWLRPAWVAIQLHFCATECTAQCTNERTAQNFTI